MKNNPNIPINFDAVSDKHPILESSNGRINGFNKNEIESISEEYFLKIRDIYIKHLQTKNERTLNLLTPREKEFIQCICEGKKTEEIAKSLNVSKHTVESHRSNIFSKLDIRNSTELVALAFRVGLVW